MKLRSILTIGLLAVISLAACAPAATPTPAQAEMTVQPVPPATEPPAQTPSAPAEFQSQPTQAEVLPTEAPSEVVQVVATSRGPNLEATDPSTVSLASGDLQLVEFFRFT